MRCPDIFQLRDSSVPANDVIHQNIIVPKVIHGLPEILRIFIVIQLIFRSFFSYHIVLNFALFRETWKTMRIAVFP